MLPQEIFALAQQGDPIAIEWLLNHEMRSRGIQVRVQRQDHFLHILLQSQQPIDRAQAIALVQRRLEGLNLESIPTIMVYSQRQATTPLDWQQKILLRSPFDSSLLEGDLFAPAVLLSDLSDRSHSSDLSDSSDADLPPSRRDAVTQASNFFPESLEPSPHEAVDTLSEPSSEPLSDSLSDPLSKHSPEAEPQGRVEPAQSPALPPAHAQLSDANLLPEAAPELLKRPESVIFLLFISLFFFWDAYLDFVEEDFSANTTAISASQLARRLKVSRKTIRRRKREPDFPTWSQSLDPDAIAWTYRKGYYLAQSLF